MAVTDRIPANMKCPANNSRSERAFTLIELLVVIAIIGILASLIVGLAGLAGRRSKESRVKAELAQYVTAIDKFKDQFGYYPPDNVISMSAAGTNVDSAINPLFYELTGVFVDNTARLFRSASGQVQWTQGAVMAVFRRDGFVNAVEAKQAKSTKSFLP